MLFSRKKLSSFLKSLWYLSIAIAGSIEFSMVPGYRPWKTINTTMDICLLVGNDNKKNETKCLSSHFATLRPSLGHWQGGSLIHSLLIKTLFQVRPEVHREPCKNVGSHSMTEHISGIRVGTLPILNVTCYPIVSLTTKLYQKQLTI